LQGFQCLQTRRPLSRGPEHCNRRPASPYQMEAFSPGEENVGAVPFLLVSRWVPFFSRLEPLSSLIPWILFSAVLPPTALLRLVLAPPMRSLRVPALSFSVGEQTYALFMSPSSSVPWDGAAFSVNLCPSIRFSREERKTWLFFSCCLRDGSSPEAMQSRFELTSSFFRPIPKPDIEPLDECKAHRLPPPLSDEPFLMRACPPSVRSTFPAAKLCDSDSASLLPSLSPREVPFLFFFKEGEGRCVLPFFPFARDRKFFLEDVPACVYPPFLSLLSSRTFFFVQAGECGFPGVRQILLVAVPSCRQLFLPQEERGSGPL